MKYLALLAISLTGCLMEPEQKTVTRDYSVGPECLGQEDSVTWTDTTETRHHSCVVDPTEPRDPSDPRPPSPSLDTLTHKEAL
jgi:hypothetical protein